MFDPSSMLTDTLDYGDLFSEMPRSTTRPTFDLPLDSFIDSLYSPDAQPSHTPSTMPMSTQIEGGLQFDRQPRHRRGRNPGATLAPRPSRAMGLDPNKTPVENKCTNCDSKATPMWRRDEQECVASELLSSDMLNFLAVDCSAMRALALSPLPLDQ